jgi:hypothetical protein
MKQTAVEWLVEELTRQNMFMHLFAKEIEQAKEMEKEQIIKAINFGDERGKITTYKSAEQYYNETFKSE